VRIAVIGTQCHRPLVVRHGIAGHARIAQQVREIVVRIGVVRAQGDRGTIGSRRLISQAPHLQQIGKVVMRLGVIRAAGDHIAIGRLRLIKPSAMAQRDGEIVIAGYLRGIDRDGACKRVGCLGMVSQRQCGSAQQVTNRVRTRVILRQCVGLPHSFGKQAALVGGHRRAEYRLRGIAHRYTDLFELAQPLVHAQIARVAGVGLTIEPERRVPLPAPFGGLGFS